MSTEQEPFRVISLGWGVQSFALAAMSALGELPKVNTAVHADTTHERQETYEFAAKWTPWLEEHGVRVVTVQDEIVPQQISDPEKKGVYIPAYTIDKKNGDYGQLVRSCTQRIKIAPIRRWIQANRLGRQTELWFGITLDEVERMRISNVSYIVNHFPFIQDLYPRWTRMKVTQWLLKNELEIPARSACVFCPFHNIAVWREIRQNADNWQRALATDEAIRSKRPEHTCYLTSEHKPLEECDFSSQEDHGQLELWQECTGMCFL